MVELFRAPDSTEADAIAEALRDLSIARTITTVRSEDDLPDAASFSVDDLEALMADWYRFQSDTCELDTEGNMC